jgi:hypothetical protein
VTVTVSDRHGPVTVIGPGVGIETRTQTRDAGCVLGLEFSSRARHASAGRESPALGYTLSHRARNFNESSDTQAGSGSRLQTVDAAAAA